MGHPPMSGQAFRALASAALQGAGVLNGLAPAEGEPLDDEAMLTRFGGAAASFRRSFNAMPEEERDAAGEGRLLQAFGGLAFSLMRDASPEVSDRVAERLNGPAMRGLSGVLLRLGDAERGFPQDAGFRDALAFNAFQSGLRAALGGRAETPATFAGELSLIPQADRGRLRAALPGLADTLDASFPALSLIHIWVAATQARFGREAAGAMIERALADIAAALVETGVRRILVAGGETSGAVVSRLGVRALRIGETIAPGVPWTETLLDPANPDAPHLALALKSGNFGGEDFFMQALGLLANAN